MEILLHCWCKCKTEYLLWRTVWKFLKKLHIGLPHSARVHFTPGVYTRELQTYLYTKTWAWMFMGAVFITAKSPTDKLIYKIQYNYTMECYLSIQKKWRVRNMWSAHIFFRRWRHWMFLVISKSMISVYED